MNGLKKIFTGLVTCLSTAAFSLTLHNVTIEDPLLGSRFITYNQLTDGTALVEDDIIVQLHPQNNTFNAVFRPKISGSRWAHGIIPFELDEELPFPSKLAVFQAMNHWQEKTNIRFIELNSKNRQSYPDFIKFVPNAGNTCASSVGKQGGQQQIILAPRCTTMNTVHEIGHSLGLWHEQSRADRDQFIQIIWENIDDDHRYNFNQQLHDGQDYDTYDYDSIMHYGEYAFSKNGQKTIIPLMAGSKIGQREHLSVKDIDAVLAMYPEV
jgi:uncharacterized protein YxeA